MQNVLFILPTACVGLAAALHATAYLHGEARRHQPRFWTFFVLTLAAMLGVVLSPDRLTFLLAWEAMGLASAGLVAFENEDRAARKATWIYLLACHAGACALMLAGILLDRPEAAWGAFACAVVGFGLKIGFPPFHVWLPEAHPAAPAPASAVMSGAMIPLGFYGLWRFVLDPEVGFALTPAMAWTVLALGAVGALGGILFALPQTNLKKLLAFSSVENMGVIALGLGLVLLANAPVEVSAPSEGGLRLDLGRMETVGTIAAFAGAGAFIHVLNHAFLKGALFLGAGSVLRQTGTLNQDLLGGLMKRMPVTGTLFTLNALGLAGLPPLNGFLGEFLIYVAAFRAVQSGVPALIGAGFLVLVALSLTGGLAAAAYCKAVGATFLGEPRSAAAADAVETPRRMWVAQLVLFILSLAMVPGSVYLADMMTGGATTHLLVRCTAVCSGVAFLVGALVLVRRILCPRGTVKPVCPTWDCGYHAPTARMAYTATAFTQPLQDLFHPVLRARTHVIPFRGSQYEVSDAALATETDDRALTAFWRPVFTFVARVFQRAHLLQGGSLHLYILLVLVALLVLLVLAFV